MFGCARRVGCLVLVVVLVLAAWFTRERWVPLIRDRGAVAKEGEWEPITPEGAERARKAIASLGAKSGPVYANVRAGDLASYVFQALRKQLPPSAQNVEATVIGERMYVRASVALSDFGGPGALGPLASFMSDREVMTFGGTFALLRPGLAEYRVEELKLRDLSVPKTMLPKLIQRVGRGARPAGLAPNALPLEVPTTIGDVRVGRGRVTLYKAGVGDGDR